METRYFIPHLINANPEWKDFACFSKETVITGNTPYYPKDYDLIFVERGNIKLFCNTKYKQNFFTLIVGENSLINVGGTITGANRFSKIHTDKNAVLRIYDSYFFWDLDFIKNNPELMRGLSRTVTQCINIHTQRAHHSCFYSCLPRVCQTILSLTTTNPDNPHIIHSLNQLELAQLSGMHPVTICNILKKLRAHGVIGKFGQNYIEILEPERFFEISNNLTEL